MKEVDFNAMSKEELVKLLESIRESVRYAEDAGDTILDIAEKVGVDCSV